MHQDWHNLGHVLNEAVKTPIQPVTVGKEDAPAQEVVHLATDADFDIRTLLAAPTNTPDDAGPYITMGVVRGSSPDAHSTTSLFTGWFWKTRTPSVCTSCLVAATSVPS